MDGDNRALIPVISKSGTHKIKSLPKNRIESSDRSGLPLSCLEQRVDDMMRDGDESVAQMFDRLWREWQAFKTEYWQHKANFNPNQPRVPRGHRDGGQWTDANYEDIAGGEGEATDHYGWVTVADRSLPGSIYTVDLLEEEILGGHTIKEHVGKTDLYLLSRVGGGRLNFVVVEIITYRAGSFSSVAAANKLVNATLAINREVVDLVASGRYRDAFITAEFDSITGKEAFRRTPHSEPYMRVTMGVGVRIVHDPRVAKGYRVHTAYPRRD